MADKKKMSVDEILAAARRSDSAGGAKGNSPSAAETPSAEVPSTEVPSTEVPSTETPASAAPPKKSGPMSTADILAAARAGKPGGGAASGTEKPAGASSEAPASGAAPKKSGPLSTADILAAARAGKPGAAKPAEKPTAPAAETPAKAAAPKAAPAAKAAPAKPAAAEGAGGPRDTASILAAARGAAKPGPISKAEAAARVKEAPVAKPKKKEVPPMPDKPAYAQPATPAPVTVVDDDRRGFFRGMFLAFTGSALAIGFSSLAVTFNLWTLGFARFMFPNILTEPPTKFKVGFPDELAPGQVQTKYVAQFGVWIVRYEYDGAPQIYALQTVCTHLGCTPNWLEGEQKFKCPCHGSGFYKDGINFEGPAPRPLERFAIRMADDGQLEVDKSRKFKEEMGQWRDNASFVPV